MNGVGKGQSNKDSIQRVVTVSLYEGGRKLVEGTGSKIRVSPQVDNTKFLNGIETTRIEVFIT